LSFKFLFVKANYFFLNYFYFIYNTMKKNPTFVDEIWNVNNYKRTSHRSIPYAIAKLGPYVRKFEIGPIVFVIRPNDILFAQM
jgi:hypothetical protein